MQAGEITALSVLLINGIIFFNFINISISKGYMLKSYTMIVLVFFHIIDCPEIEWSLTSVFPNNLNS